MTAEEVLEALFQNDFTYSNSDSSSDDIHKMTVIFINPDYNEKLSSQHGNNHKFSQPYPQ